MEGGGGIGLAAAGAQGASEAIPAGPRRGGRREAHAPGRLESGNQGDFRAPRRSRMIVKKV